MPECKHDGKWEPVDPNDVDEIGFSNHWRCTTCGEVKAAPSANRKAKIRRRGNVFVYAVFGMAVVGAIAIVASIAYIVWRLV